MPRDGPRKRNLNSGPLLLDKFSSYIEDFNIERQSLSTLASCCARLEIEIVREPLRRLHGCAIEIDDYKAIYINSLIPEPLQVIVGFHEFCHVVYHAVNAEGCLSTGSNWNYSRIEREAQAVGVIALMPFWEVCCFDVQGIMDYYSVPRRIAEFRAGLYM